MIMDNNTEHEKYLADLKAWLDSIKDVSPEEMDAFFTKRFEGYDEHMLSHWKGSYELMAKFIPENHGKILDLGVGTGIELEYIWERFPEAEVTGVDMSKTMLEGLKKKSEGKNLTIVCDNYFKYDMGENKWDTVISFESFHHFLHDDKVKLYKKIYNGLKEGGSFILGDYIAGSEEEEVLLRDTYFEKRRRFGIPDDQFIHFDIPMTLEHEIAIMKEAGFENIEIREGVDAMFFIAVK